MSPRPWDPGPVDAWLRVRCARAADLSAIPDPPPPHPESPAPAAALLAAAQHCWAWDAAWDAPYTSTPVARRHPQRPHEILYHAPETPAARLLRVLGALAVGRGACSPRSLCCAIAFCLYGSSPPAAGARGDIAGRILAAAARIALAHPARYSGFLRPDQPLADYLLALLNARAWPGRELLQPIADALRVSIVHVSGDGAADVEVYTPHSDGIAAAGGSVDGAPSPLAGLGLGDLSALPRVCYVGSEGGGLRFYPVVPEEMDVDAAEAAFIALLNGPETEMATGAETETDAAPSAVSVVAREIEDGRRQHQGTRSWGAAWRAHAATGGYWFTDGRRGGARAAAGGGAALAPSPSTSILWGELFPFSMQGADTGVVVGGALACVTPMSGFAVREAQGTTFLTPRPSAPRRAYHVHNWRNGRPLRVGVCVAAGVSADTSSSSSSSGRRWLDAMAHWGEPCRLGGGEVGRAVVLPPGRSVSTPTLPLGCAGQPVSVFYALADGEGDAHAV